ncbi:hypothetical protein H5410_056392, partial [Solanum commersonii]
LTCRELNAHVVVKEGKTWWKKNTKATYFSNEYIERDGVDVALTPAILNEILGTVDTDHLVCLCGSYNSFVSSCKCSSEELDYMAPLLLVPMDVTKTKGHALIMVLPSPLWREISLMK